MKVRTRFAPSPTGYLHVGGIRTALFAWLVARQSSGTFILRLEDTDKKREVKGSDKHLVDSLRALGLDYDEGPDLGGPYAPYRQSQRLDIYKKWAQKLIDSGRAYADPTTPEQLEKLRRRAIDEKRPFLFRNHRPDNPPEWDGQQPLRFKSEPKAYRWQDEVMGNLETGPEVIDDFILIKSDGFPTYNFAHIVDDAEMNVTHVIRGQEFLASVPNYLNLYDALGLERPILATVPHILGPDGRKKLSKRDGAKDVLDYLRGGVLPEALCNFIATLGWNDGTEQEVFTKDELIQKFSLARVQKSGARFDEGKLMWLNWQHAKRLLEHDPNRLYTHLAQHRLMPADLPTDRLQPGSRLAAEKSSSVEEFTSALAIFADSITPPALRDLLPTIDKDLTIDQARALLGTAGEQLEHTDFNAAALEEALRALAAEERVSPKQVLMLLGMAVSGRPKWPRLFEMLEVLGKETVLKRVRATLDANTI